MRIGGSFVGGISSACHRSGRLFGALPDWARRLTEAWQIVLVSTIIGREAIKQQAAKQHQITSLLTDASGNTHKCTKDSKMEPCLGRKGKPSTCQCKHHFVHALPEST